MLPIHILSTPFANADNQPYQLARAYSASRINASALSRSIYATAASHAVSILELEANLNMAIERPFQSFLLTKLPRAMPVLATIYYSHILIGAAFLVYAYTTFPRPVFQRIRRTIFVDNWLSFLVFTSYRCAPPRLLPDHFGFVDVLHQPKQPPASHGMGDAFANATDVLATELRHPAPLGAVQSGSIWTHNSHQLTIAAMPSLHFGTSLLIGYTLLAHAPHRLVRALAPLWPLAMLVTIVGTANHFILDAVAGACVVAVGWRIQELVLVFAPLEEYLFWCLGVERPRGAGRARKGEDLVPMGWSDADSEELEKSCIE